MFLSDPSLGLNERKRHLGLFIIAQTHAGACTYNTQRHGVIKNQAALELYTITQAGKKQKKAHTARGKKC